MAQNRASADPKQRGGVLCRLHLHRDRLLFSGDHLAWSPDQQTLIAFRDVCWYSWTEQTRSMERLLAYRFEAVLPGHGRLHHSSADDMHRHLERCVAWMGKM